MFEVPKSKRSLKANRFPFKIGTKSHDVPLLKFAPVEATLLWEQGRDTAGLLACCDKPEVEAALRTLDSDQLDALSDAWIAASRVSPGESESSDDS
ncbi:MAG TPA: hypothetical protein VGM94_09525 [Galbitalea sp.]|jgi:hypothetical protein